MIHNSEHFTVIQLVNTFPAFV